MDYEYIKNIYNIPNDINEWQNLFNGLLSACGITLKDEFGIYKDMDELFGDIAINYLKYQHDVNKIRFSGL